MHLFNSKYMFLSALYFHLDFNLAHPPHLSFLPASLSTKLIINRDTSFLVRQLPATEKLHEGSINM